MTRGHRRWHVRLWLVLGGAALAGLLVGLAVRPAPPIERAAAATEDAR